MPSKDVLKEAIRAFDGTAIIVSHDREFLDGLVSNVYEFGGGKVREHIGGIYDFLREHQIENLDALGGKSLAAVTQAQSSPKTAQQHNSNAADIPVTDSKMSYQERKEMQKKISKAEKTVKESERKIESMEKRLKELDDILCHPENASDMTIITEYTSTKKALDEEVERWEEAAMQLDELKATMG